MKRNILLIGLALIVALSLGALAGCKKTEIPVQAGGEVAETGSLAGKTIAVATDAPYPPMEMVNDDGTFTGFDIDILTAAINREGGEVSFKTFGFDALIAAMGSGGGDFDAAISSITITPEREENMIFSNPYFDANQSLAVDADSAILSVADIKPGMKVAVQTGTTGEIWANKNLKDKGVEVKGYDQIAGCFGALSAGDVDGVIVDFQVSGDYAKDPIRKVKVVEQIETGERYGVAFPKESTELRDAVNAGLETIKQDGTYVEIYKTYFGTEPVSIP